MNISVIIPVYNAATFVTKAVRSALQQQEVREVILVEDGSTDDSLAVCQGLELEDSRVKVFQHPGRQNHGAGASRNLGIEKATAPYIAFLDADDFYLENRFETAQKVFEEFPDADGVYEAVTRDFENSEVKKAYTQLYSDDSLVTMTEAVPPEQLFQTFFIGEKGWFCINGLVLKRVFLERVGRFDVNLRQTQDTDFMLRLSLKGRLYHGNLKTPVAAINIHGENRILKATKVAHYRHLLFKKWFGLMLGTNWNKRVNKHVIRGMLYTHPRIFKYRNAPVMRIILKTFYLTGYMLRQPKVFSKFFF